MASNVKRIIKEEGIVLEKIFKEATNEFMGSDGKLIPAQPDRYILRVVSGEEYKKDVGYVSSNILDYPVEKALWDKAEGFSKVIARFEMSLKIKPVSIELVKETK